MPEKVHIKFSDDSGGQGVKRSRDGSPKSSPTAPSRATSAPADSELPEPTKAMTSHEDRIIGAKKVKKDDVTSKSDKVDKVDKHIHGEKRATKTVDPKSFYNSGGAPSGTLQSAKSLKAAPEALSTSTDDLGNVGEISTKGTNGPQSGNLSNGTSNGTSKSSSSSSSSGIKSSAQKRSRSPDSTSKTTVPSSTHGVLSRPNGDAVKGQAQRQSSTASSQSTPSRGSPGALPKVNRSQIARVEAQLYKERQKLPIWKHRADIRWSLRNSDVLLLVGETGSGKSTQVPQFLLGEPWFARKLVKIENENGHIRDVNVGGIIAITEPRRVAATSLAHRVAQETGSYIGQKALSNDSDEVGYSVRFDSYMPSQARIKYLTEGMLLQEMLHDPHLRRYSAIIIDEIHERSVDVDLVAGFVRNIVTGDKKGRGGVPLKVIAMSATANMRGLQRFFSSSTTFGTRPNGHFGFQNTNGVSDGAIELQGNRNGDSRRASDASYSSWDGIASEDETEKETASSPNTDRSSSSPAQIDPEDVTIHHIAGNQYDVEVFYTPEPVQDYVQAMLKTIFLIHTKEPLPGDILAFLTGQEEIESIQQLVKEFSNNLAKNIPHLEAVPLYGQLNMEQQQAAFKRPLNARTRKVVLATNIAETSVTVPGVRFVIDCGKAKVKRYRSRLGLESLLVTPISQSSSIQRKGRAGREAKGKCYRLYTEKEYLQLHKADDPEILRSNVTEAVLKMKARGVVDVMAFPLMDPLEPEAMHTAILNLHSIGALNDDQSLSETGRKMSEFPLTAPYGRVLVAASEPANDCLLEAIDVISCLTAGEDIFIQPKSEEKRDEVEEARRDLLRREGDILTYLTTMQKYASENINRYTWCQNRSINVSVMKRAMDIRRQLRQMCHQKGLLAEKAPQDPQPFVPMTSERAEVFLKSFLKAFSMKTAILHPDGSYMTMQGKNAVAIHPSSVMYGQKKEAIMFLEHVFTQKNYAKKVSAIQMDWIFEAMVI